MNEPLPLEARRAKWGTPIVVANFKAHKSWIDVESWIDQVGSSVSDFAGTVIVCPSFPFLASDY